MRVLLLTEKKNKRNYRMFIVQCDCGRVEERSSQSLRQAMKQNSETSCWHCKSNAPLSAKPLVEAYSLDEYVKKTKQLANGELENENNENK